MKLRSNEEPPWKRKERRQRRRAARRAKLLEIDPPQTSAIESQAMAEARARALQMAAEAAEIAAEEAKTLQRAARRKAEEQEKMERERVAVCQHQTPEQGQKCSTNYIPTSPELYRYRHNLHRWLLLSMYNYEALSSEDDDNSDLVQPGDEYVSDYTSDSY